MISTKLSQRIAKTLQTLVFEQKKFWQRFGCKNLFLIN